MHTGITVFVIDKHPIIGWALNEYFSRHSRIIVLGNALSTRDALAVVKQKRPHVVIMGTSQPDMTCLEAVENIVSMGTQVVAFWDPEKKELVDAFLKAGGIGFVAKSSPLDDLRKAVESAAQKKRWISPSLHATLALETTSVASLSNREREIVALVAQGLTSKIIAEQLFISINTVESHRKRIFKKLNIHTCAQLVRYAINERLISETP